MLRKKHHFLHHIDVAMFSNFLSHGSWTQLSDALKQKRKHEKLMCQICTIDFSSASNICYCKDMLFNNFDMFNTSSSYKMLVQDLHKDQLSNLVECKASLLYRICLYIWYYIPTLFLYHCFFSHCLLDLLAMSSPWWRWISEGLFIFIYTQVYIGVVGIIMVFSTVL